MSDPLGSYLRVTRSDHTFLAQMAVENRLGTTGLIADPALLSQQQSFWNTIHAHGVETVLDPRTLDLSTPGGFMRSGADSLPWAGDSPHQPGDLAGPAGRLVCAMIADAVQQGGFTAVLAPTHCIGGAPQAEQWLPVDAELTEALRQSLNSRGMQKTPIYYPLIVKTEQFYSEEWRANLKAHLQRLPSIDALWLRIHPFGTAKAGPNSLPKYLAACRDLHELAIPLVGEHTGSIGVALMAFGAIGGIESGVTTNDHTDLSGWLNQPKKSGGGGSEARIYFHALGQFVPRSTAEMLFQRPGMKTAHSCRDTSCCARGWRDTEVFYREHFVTRRASEVVSLSQAPENLRPGLYLEDFLRPASDAAARIAALAPVLAGVRARLDSWRGTLGADLTTHSGFSFSPPAAGKLLRRTA